MKRDGLWTVMCAKYLSSALLLLLFARFAESQEPTSHPIHDFFFFSGAGDFNRSVFYRNKLEFSLDSGWEPINIPFVYNFVTSSTYTTWPLHYTLEPNIASVRWTIDNIDWPSILRGTTDYTFSGTYVDIPRGPKTRYFAFCLEYAVTSFGRTGG
jgi:hypothetical protein